MCLLDGVLTVLISHNIREKAHQPAEEFYAGGKLSEAYRNF